MNVRDRAAKALTDAGLGDVPMQAIDIVVATYVAAANEDGAS